MVTTTGLRDYGTTGLRDDKTTRLKQQRNRGVLSFGLVRVTPGFNCFVVSSSLGPVVLWPRSLVVLWSLCACCHAAEYFQLPTANHALFDKGGEEKFFAGTPGDAWPTGTFA